jgi:hypothetical protein
MPAIDWAASHRKGARKMKVATLATALGFYMASVPAFAHHGTNISYDSGHLITLKAIVTDFRFANPHAHIFFDVTNDKGQIVHWSGELTDPSNLARNGWTRKRSEKELPAGTPVTITIAPSKAGTSVGLVMKIVNEKGEQILMSRPVPGEGQ